jgi:hypothetical protein
MHHPLTTNRPALTLQRLIDAVKGHTIKRNVSCFIQNSFLCKERSQTQTQLKYNTTTLLLGWFCLSSSGHLDIDHQTLGYLAFLWTRKGIRDRQDGLFSL